MIDFPKWIHSTNTFIVLSPEESGLPATILRFWSFGSFFNADFHPRPIRPKPPHSSAPKLTGYYSFCRVPHWTGVGLEPWSNAPPPYLAFSVIL